jgi:PIN like domain
VSPPRRPPKFFIDRSLGRVAVPAGLREDGWEVVTLAEHYGMPRDEEVADTEWIADAASRGWPILMKDKRIRHRRAEIEAVATNKAKCFVITRGDLTSADMVRRLVTNKQAIFRAIVTSGPYIYSVQQDRLDQLYPKKLLTRSPWRVVRGAGLKVARKALEATPPVFVASSALPGRGPVSWAVPAQARTTTGSVITPATAEAAATAGLER